MSRHPHRTPGAVLALLFIAAVAAAAPKGAAPKPAAAPKTSSSANAGGNAAEALLDSVAATYRGFANYDIQGTSHMTMEMGGQTQQMEVPFRLAAAKPARLRNEIMNPMMPYVNVSDGSKTWVYLPSSHQYTEKEASPLTSAGGASNEAGNAMAAGTPIERYLTTRSGLKSARMAGSGEVEFAGRKVPCTLVQAEYATPDSGRITLSPNTLWIDRARRLVLRDSFEMRLSAPDGSPVRMAQVTTFHRLEIDGTPPDTLFSFHPPAGAKLVASFESQGASEPSSPLVGKPAEDFALADLAGKRQKLSGLKGKVVLLDFWATWCGPCRRELPTVAKLHKELATKGLAVVAVNVGEPAETVNAFLKKNNYALPVWLDVNTEVSAKYGASSIPTLVVIDKAGTVSAYKVGVHDEAALRGLIEAAGVK